MKLSILKLLLLVGFLGTVSAQPFSISAGLDVNLGGAPNFLVMSYENSGLNAKLNGTRSILLLDIGVFADFTYGFLRFGYSFNPGEATSKNEFTMGGNTNTQELKEKLSYLTLGLYGKYPFVLSQMVSLFPYLGILWMPNLVYEETTNNVKKSDLTADQQKDLDDFYLGGGLGVDLNLTESIYLRATGEYHYNLLAKPSSNPMPGFDLKSYSGMKFGGSLAVGYKFF